VLAAADRAVDMAQRSMRGEVGSLTHRVPGLGNRGLLPEDHSGLPQAASGGPAFAAGDTACGGSLRRW